MTAATSVRMRFTFPDGEAQEHTVPYPLLDVVKLVQRPRDDHLLIDAPPRGEVPKLDVVLFRLVRVVDARTGREQAEYHLDSSHIIALARDLPISSLRPGPRPGDLVVDPAMIRRDDNAIGWLVAHGEAPYSKDGTGEMREVWDVIPLARGHSGTPLRWENAEFYTLPDSLAALVGKTS